MRVADLTSGTAKLHDSLKKLRVRWEDTKNYWNDPVSREFEETFLDPLDPKIIATLERMRRLSAMLNSAERECS